MLLCLKTEKEAASETCVLKKLDGGQNPKTLDFVS